MTSKFSGLFFSLKFSDIFKKSRERDHTRYSPYSESPPSWFFSGGVALCTSNSGHGFSCPASPHGSNFIIWNSCAIATRLCGLELPVMALKNCKAAIALTQAQNPAPGMFDHPIRLEHYLLHHRPNATAFGRVAHRRVGLIEGVLPIRRNRFIATAASCHTR